MKRMTRQIWGLFAFPRSVFFF